MAITEHSRNELHNALTDRIGKPAASTLMELLPPVGWADVATKRDLDHLDERFSTKLDNLDERLTTRIDNLAELMQAELKSVASQKDLNQFLYTVLAFNLALVAAVLGVTGLT